MAGFSGFRLVGLVAAVLIGAVALAGCGSAAPLKPGPKVTLALRGPVNGSRTSSQSTTVSGTVRPHRATVLVLGRRVTVGHDGSFSAPVGLAVGTNLIDIEASVARSAGAVEAIKVIRFLLVSVPQVGGDSPTQAAQAIQALGLKVKTDGSSDPFNFLIPGSNEVCSETPAAGTKVNPGSTVTIKTSKVCF